jgi:hypothetical protein
MMEECSQLFGNEYGARLQRKREMIIDNEYDKRYTMKPIYERNTSLYF